MRGGYCTHSQRRKRLLRVAPLVRSQSLDAVSCSPLSPRKYLGGGSSSKETEKSGSTKNRPGGPQHLPPLGQKDRRPSIIASPLQQEQQEQEQLSTRENADGFALCRYPVMGRAPSFDSPTGAVDISKLEWAERADIFVQPRQTAGIAFQWVETQATPPAAGAAAEPLAGLRVLSVAECSLAARHGGISPGMMLVEISRKNIAGMSQDQVMRLMRTVASQPRVLTLARVATPPQLSTSAPEVRFSRSSGENRSEYTTNTFAMEDPLTPSNLSGVFGFLSEDTRRALPRPTATQRPSSGESSSAMSKPRFSKASSVCKNDGDTPSIASSGSALFSTPYISNRNRQTLADPSFSAGSTNDGHHQRAPLSSSSQKLLALRFVGSRGDTTLFDRDHVLGLCTQNIEFVPTHVVGGGIESHSSTTAAKQLQHQANSHRSLQDLTSDWRNDPFSTPARRRRLINDICKLIVHSYTHASAWRVAELRREERFVTRIQAAFRMQLARRLFLEKRAARRVRAASVLQLGWLSCTARRRMRVLREERDREVRRRRREAFEEQERRRRRQQEEREREEQESRQRRERSLVISVQRCFRVQRQERLRLVQEAERLRTHQLREERILLRAATFIQAGFRRHRRRRRRREAEAHEKLALYDKVTKQTAASARLQRAWRRCTAVRVLDEQRRKRTESAPPPSSLAALGGGHDSGAPGAPWTALENGDQRFADGRKGPAYEGAEFTWGNWASAPRVGGSVVGGRPGEGDEHTASESARPRTAAGAVQHAVSKASLGRPPYSSPPAGMMTVTVRRGSEETNLVTPIVLTESGEEEETQTPVRGDGADGVVGCVKRESGRDKGENQRSTASLSAAARNARTNSPSAADVIGAAARSPHTTEPAAREMASGEQGISLVATNEAMVSSAIRNTSHPAPPNSLGSGGLAAAARYGPAFVPTSTAIENNGAAIILGAGQSEVGAAACATRQVALDDSGTLAARPPPTAESGEESSRMVIKPSKQLFMEDTQVYLGCVVCGVKYLVEAVDPTLSQAVQAGQPAPEVLYLCTTCGGTLRNNGESGRWKRRRRPSSAPAARLRRGSASFFDGGGAGRSTDINGNGNGDKPNGVDVSHDSGDSARLSLVEGAAKRKERHATTARLRYAYCARMIQHVYRDFRHRMYLRDWALDLLRHWLLRRLHLRKRAGLRHVRRLAAVTLQSAARAASARARCSALRAARLQFWMDTVATLYSDAANDGDRGGGACCPSPAAAELLGEMNSPPPPLPTPPPSLAVGAAGASAAAREYNSVKCMKNIASRGRALAAALAPRMGQPPPGCPTALDVDWGEWGVGLRLVFPHSPHVESCK